MCLRFLLNTSPISEHAYSFCPLKTNFWNGKKQEILRFKGGRLILNCSQNLFVSLVYNRCIMTVIKCIQKANTITTAKLKN